MFVFEIAANSVSLFCAVFMDIFEHLIICTFCLVDADEDWWIIYAVVFGAAGLSVLLVILFLCCIELSRNED